MLTNTFQLAQRTPGQPGRHSTGCVHRLAGQEWLSGDIRTNQKHLAVASGRPCNIYWSATRWTLPALPKTWQQLMASPSAVPGTMWRTCIFWWKDKNDDDLTTSNRIQTLEASLQSGYLLPRPRISWRKVQCLYIDTYHWFLCDHPCQLSHCPHWRCPGGLHGLPHSSTSNGHRSK